MAQREYNGSMAELRWVEGDTTHKVRLETTPVGIGRASDNQLVLKDFSVSRHHAKVEQRGEAWWVVRPRLDQRRQGQRRATSARRCWSTATRSRSATSRSPSTAPSRSRSVSVSSSTFLRSIDEFREDFRLEREPVRKRTPRPSTRPRARARGARPGGAHAARGRGARAGARQGDGGRVRAAPGRPRVRPAVHRRRQGRAAHGALPRRHAARRGAGLADHPRPGEPPEGRRADLRRPGRRALRGRA